MISYRAGLTKEWIHFSFTQKIASWCVELADFEVPNKIQSVMVWPVVIKMIQHMSSFVANVNWNDARRLKVNVNRLSNDNVWNADNRNRVVLPLLAISPIIYLVGVFVCRPFFQPPSCRPISPSRVNKSEYFSVGINLLSHAS